MSNKSPAKRIEYLESVVMGAGFLLKKLQHTYGSDFGMGMTEQVAQCIRECNEVGRVNVTRKAREAAKVKDQS